MTDAINSTDTKAQRLKPPKNPPLVLFPKNLVQSFRVEAPQLTCLKASFTLIQRALRQLKPGSFDAENTVQNFWEKALATSARSLEVIGLYLAKPVALLSEPMIRALFTPIRPGEWKNLPYAFLERIWRIFIVTIGLVAAPFAIALALGGNLLYKIADFIKKKDYTYLEGTLPELEESKKETKALTLNACMLWGGLPIPLGGMPPPSDRMDALVQLIKTHRPDILLMQEMAFGPGYTLYHKIKDQYAHFFTRIGSNPPAMESGLFFASKYPVIKANFLPFPDQGGIYRGAFLIETKESVYITTHMEYNKQDVALKQLAIIDEEIKKYKGKKPCYLLGDFNLDRRHNPQFANKLIELFHDPYTGNAPTCSDYFQANMLGKTPPPASKDELVDYTLMARDDSFNRILTSKVLDTYDKKCPYEATTDHKGLLLSIS